MKHLLSIISIVTLSALVASCKKEGAAVDTKDTLVKLERIDILPPPETVAVKIKGYCPAAGRTYKDLFATNFSAKIYNHKLEVDGDKDGIANITEVNANLDPLAPLNIGPVFADSNQDNFSDLFIYLSGIDRSEELKLRCVDTSSNDGMGTFYNDPKITTGNPIQFLGLRNCEKAYLKLDQFKFDSDGDSIPDYLEMRCGLNPKDPNDAVLDPDGDKVSNVEECKRNTPINESNLDQGIKQYEYQYDIQPDRAGPGCMQITISNIPIVNGGDDNLLGLFLVEADGLQNNHLYSAYLALNAGAKDTMIEFNFSDRFVAR